MLKRVVAFLPEIRYSPPMEIDAALKQKVASYQPSDLVKDQLNKTAILLLVAISGGGKDTIKYRLLDTGQYRHIISYTTRQPRINNGVQEQDGDDYHFINAETANRMLDEGTYIEADLFANNVYGTGIADIVAAEQEGKIAVTDMTIEGAFHYLRLAPSVKAVFLLPPSYEIWMSRLTRRGVSTPEDLRRRMQEAADEIEHAMQAENMYIVINDELEDAIQVVDDIAHNKPVEPHYHKAMAIAEQLLQRIREELAKTSDTLQK